MSPEKHTPSFTIGRATPEDAEVICDIRDRAWLAAYPNPELGITVEDVRLMAKGPNDEYVPRRVEYLKNQLAKEDGVHDTTFVAKIEGKVVGFVDPRIDGMGRRRVGAVYVAPEHQGKGVGGQLMKQLLEWYGREHDIYLEVVSYNQNAIEFYERLGFEKTGLSAPEEPNRPNYLKHLPQIEMVLRKTTKVS